MTGADRAGFPERAKSLLASARIHHSPCGGGRLTWQQWSEPEAGPPLLLMHGGFGSWTHWLANIDVLRQQRELWTLDLPGLGASADIFRAATSPLTATGAARSAVVMSALQILLVFIGPLPSCLEPIRRSVR